MTGHTMRLLGRHLLLACNTAALILTAQMAEAGLLLTYDAPVLHVVPGATVDLATSSSSLRIVATLSPLSLASLPIDHGRPARAPESGAA
jgi:hypothetical protein